MIANRMQRWISRAVVGLAAGLLTGAVMAQAVGPKGGELALPIAPSCEVSIRARDRKSVV